MSIIVRRSNNQEQSYKRQLTPEVGPEQIYFHWDTGGLERSAFWSLRIDTSSFDLVVRAMLASDRNATLDAIAAALKAEGAETAE